MKPKHLHPGRILYLLILPVLCLLIASSGAGIAFGQKKPGSLNQGTTPDDKKLCRVKTDTDRVWTNEDSEFCTFYKKYMSDTNEAEKQLARNGMIDLVEGQIETYYKDRKYNRKTLVANLQMLFDILEIGTAAATGIIKGTLRAKSVLAQALSGFQAGRTAANRNFELLQTQVLINAMDTHRAQIATEIEAGKKLDTAAYSWYGAKRDLIRLLNAGTFSEALDKLVKKTGEDAAKAEKALADLKALKIERRILGDPTEAEILTTEKATAGIDALRNAYRSAADPTAPGVITADQEKVLKKYQNIYAAIKANDALFARFNKMADNPDYDADLKEIILDIVGKLAADPTQVTAKEYNRILGIFLDAVKSDETLGPAYVKILTDNK